MTRRADSAILPARGCAPSPGAGSWRWRGEGDVKRMLALRFAAIWLGLLAAASTSPARAGDGGVVAVDALEVFDEPDETSYSSATLRRGVRVSVVAGGKGGWLAIEPPEEALDWVAQHAIRESGDGRAEVVADDAPLRSGRSEARMPGPPRPSLPGGSLVELLDLPSITLTQGRATIAWRAIRPPLGEVRYVRAEGIRRDPGHLSPGSRASPEPPASMSPTEVVATGPPGDDPIEEAARRFDEAVARSRRHDHEVDQIRARLMKARTTVDRGYDAKGYLQASSRKVDGQKVHALIGAKGTPVAYLDIPPGIATAPLLARKVGVRGSVRFVESLGTRLITVRDLDPLDDLP